MDVFFSHFLHPKSSKQSKAVKQCMFFYPSISGLDVNFSFFYIHRYLLPINFGRGIFCGMYFLLMNFYAMKHILFSTAHIVTLFAFNVDERRTGGLELFF
jgi:hypothetical protein